MLIIKCLKCSGQLNLVVGGLDTDAMYDYGHAVGEGIRDAYDAAVDAVTDVFIWIDKLDGSFDGELI